MTERGAALRQGAEEVTDRLFYAPWSCLNAAEIEDLRGLLTQLCDQYAQVSEESTG